jgi:hypothetical protein
MHFEMNSVAKTEKEEIHRLGMIIHNKEYKTALNQMARATARKVLNIAGFDPYLNQPGGSEFASAMASARDNIAHQEAAEQEAFQLFKSWTSNEGRDPRIKTLVILMERVRSRFNGKMENAMEVLFSQCQEITHLSWALTKFGKTDCAFGSSGLKHSNENDSHCPSIYHQSRDAAFAIADDMLQDGTLNTIFGLNPSNCSVAIPGMPPFYFGDVTPGIDYALDTLDFGIQKNQGNQKNDCGVHASIWNRKDGTGLALSNQPYIVPMAMCVKRMVQDSQDSQEKKPFILEDGTKVGSPIKFQCSRLCLKLIQGQKRNDHLVGGDRYIGLALDKNTVSLLQRFQKTLMPSSFIIDTSFSPHLSIAVVAPNWCPHFKSLKKLAQVAKLMKKGIDLSAFHNDHIASYRTFRSAGTPSETAWDVYEDAASRLSQCRFNHRLIETLGFKTVIVSPKIAKEDDLSPTVYNGAAACAALRSMEFDTTIIRWGKGGIRSFSCDGCEGCDGCEEFKGEAKLSTMTAHTYRRLRMSDDEHAALQERECTRMSVYS